MSGYGIQLQEKQKLRHMYGMNEKQFRNLFDKASKQKGIAGENFMILLESRLDNLVYRLGFANSRAGSRQLVSHGHVTVNGKKVDIASYTVSIGDVIGLRESSRTMKSIKEAVEGRNYLQTTLNITKLLLKASTFVSLIAANFHKKLTRNKSLSFTAVNKLERSKGNFGPLFFSNTRKLFLWNETHRAVKGRRRRFTLVV